jgi:polygalacturonase
MSGGMQNITVSGCDFTQTATGLNIKYSAYRGGYVQDIHYKDIVVGSTSRAALTVNSNYGSHNPRCATAPLRGPSWRQFWLRCTYVITYVLVKRY